MFHPSKGGHFQFSPQYDDRIMLLKKQKQNKLPNGKPNWIIITEKFNNYFYLSLSWETIMGRYTQLSEKQKKSSLEIFDKFVNKEYSLDQLICQTGKEKKTIKQQLITVLANRIFKIFQLYIKNYSNQLRPNFASEQTAKNMGTQIIHWNIIKNIKQNYQFVNLYILQNKDIQSLQVLKSIFNELIIFESFLEVTPRFKKIPIKQSANHEKLNQFTKKTYKKRQTINLMSDQEIQENQVKLEEQEQMQYDPRSVFQQMVILRGNLSHLEKKDPQTMTSQQITYFSREAIKFEFLIWIYHNSEALQS